jgi:hypothetical protein
MSEAERFHLRGIYRTPIHWIGQVVTDEIRGEVVITGTNSAPLPWPLGRRDGGASTLVIYRGLADALFRESNRAVAHWWGVSASAVSRWRRLLGVPRGPQRGHPPAPG